MMVPVSATISDASNEFSPILFSGDIAQCIVQAASIGYDGIELHIPDPNKLDAPALKRILGDYGLSLTTIGMGRAYLEEGICFCHEDAGVRQKAVDRVKESIDLFYDCSPAIIIGLMKGMLTRAPDRETGISWIDACMHAVADAAEESGVSILIEAANRYEQDYIHTAAEACEVILRLQRPHIKMLLDTFHMNIEEPSFVTAITTYSSYIGHVHLSDNTRTYPGSGSIDFTYLFDKFNDIKYTGTYAVECLPLPDPQTAARKALQHLRLSEEKSHTKRSD